MLAVVYSNVSVSVVSSHVKALPILFPDYLVHSVRNPSKVPVSIGSQFPSGLRVSFTMRGFNIPSVDSQASILSLVSDGVICTVNKLLVAVTIALVGVCISHPTSVR